MILPRKIGLAAHDVVVWLLANEPNVRQAVEFFADGQANVDYVDVAGPPNAADLAKYQRHKSGGVPLPCVRLRLRMVRHHLTGEPGVRVDCSEREMEELGRWRFEATFKRRSANG